MARTRKYLDGYLEYTACEICGGEKIKDHSYVNCTTDYCCQLCGERYYEEVLVGEDGQALYEENGVHLKTKPHYFEGYGTACLIFKSELNKYGKEYYLNSKEEVSDLLSYFKEVKDELDASESYIYLFDKKAGKGEFFYGSLPNNGQYVE